MAAFIKGHGIQKSFQKYLRYPSAGQNFFCGFLPLIPVILHTIPGNFCAVLKLDGFQFFLGNGITQVSKVSKCANGGFVTGRADDITTLHLEKAQDMQIAKATADALEARLSYVFMLNSAVQRSGERVTAEEIRYVAGELEDTLGGIYSILSQELQLPLARRILVQLQATGQIADLPEDIVSPAIITGMEALGRGHDLNKLTTFLSVIGQNPEASAALNWTGLTLAIASSCGIDTTGIIKTPEQIQAEQQQAMMMNMAQGAAPNIAKGVMDAANQPTQ
jgi:hypothetical protein